MTTLSPTELRGTISLSVIMALRMFGLFMVLPLFSLYAHQLSDATPFLIGVAMGVYGLTQCLLQIPFGLISDHFGRRKIITLGLLLFALGSILAAFADSIGGMIIARALQGMGAIGSTAMAMIADLTRPQQRTKAMAITGISIGLSFSFAMMLGPLLAKWFTLPGLFGLAAVFSWLAILILFLWTPVPEHSSWHHDTEPELLQMSALLKHAQLMRLNVGIFILHAIFTASFIIIPVSLQNLAGLQAEQQWLLYLPILLISFLLTIPLVVLAEKNHQIKTYFLAAIVILAIAEFILWGFAKNLLLSGMGLLLFFTAFSVLEAFLPSLISQTAPPKRKGTALGIYSSSQFLGIFVGGAVGGWLYGLLGLTDVYLFCIALIGIWFAIAFGMKKPQYH